MNFILICTVDYDKAIEYAMNRRCGDPAIYNSKRLDEHPLPNLHVDDTDVDEQCDIDGADDLSRDFDDLLIQDGDAMTENSFILINGVNQTS